MKNKKRRICYKCKAKKYKKYLEIYTKDDGYISSRWVCKNSEKCLARGANYKK